MARPAFCCLLVGAVVAQGFPVLVRVMLQGGVVHMRFRPTHLLATESAAFREKERTRMVQYMTFWGWVLVAKMARSPVQLPNAQVQGSSSTMAATVYIYKP